MEITSALPSQLRVVVVFLGVIAAVVMGDPFLNADPLPNGQCCGIDYYDCCGCQEVLMGQKVHAQLATGPYQKCTTAPNQGFNCMQPLSVCFSGKNIQLYSGISGTPCSSTCNTPTILGDVTRSRDQCEVGKDNTDSCD
jgi:hypothetical protein